jgi:hypothetical protein
MQYLPLFLLMMAVLIAAYFYLERAKVRDGNGKAATDGTAATAAGAGSTPADRSAE